MKHIYIVLAVRDPDDMCYEMQENLFIYIVQSKIS